MTGLVDESVTAVVSFWEGVDTAEVDALQTPKDMMAGLQASGFRWVGGGGGEVCVCVCVCVVGGVGDV